MTRPLAWSVTPWRVNGKGGWVQQPVILVEGQPPFLAETPEEYVKKLQDLHDDPRLARGAFYTMIGQLRDMMETGWLSNRETRRARK